MAKYFAMFIAGALAATFSQLAYAAIRKHFLMNRIMAVDMANPGGHRSKPELSVKPSRLHDLNGILLEDYGSLISLSGRAGSARCTMQYSDAKIRSVIVSLGGTKVFSMDVFDDGRCGNTSLVFGWDPSKTESKQLVDADGDGWFDLLFDRFGDEERVYSLQGYEVSPLGEKAGQDTQVVRKPNSLDAQPQR